MVSALPPGGLATAAAAASPSCLRLKGDGGSVAVRGLFSLVSSTPLSFSDRSSLGGVSPFTGACCKNDRSIMTEYKHKALSLYCETTKTADNKKTKMHTQH